MVQSFIRLLAVSCCVIAGLHGGPAEARRVALVIGNADYKVGPLQNPVNDAAAVAEAFEKRLKFDKVILRKNLGAEAFRAALLELSREASGAELGVVYFAGHGTEVGGKNFLIPVDATLPRASALALEAIPLDAVLEQLDGVRRLKLVILDACRNNIFQLGGAKRSHGRGLVRVEPEGNTLVAFAAKEGTTADDGKGRHSPYTAALLKHIATAGLEINLLFRRVRSDVLAATGGSQQPAEYHSLGDKEIFLVPPLPAVAAPPAPVQPPSEAQRTWAAVKDSASIAALEAFQRQYGAANPVFDRLAEARIEELKKQQVALVVPPPAPKPEPPPVTAPPPTPVPAPSPEPAVGAVPPARAAKPLTPAEEQALRPKDSFRECDNCPEMVVVPAGSFMMGSSPEEIAALVKQHRIEDYRGEAPRHRVIIARPFAVGKFEATFAEWDACVADGGCAGNRTPSDQGWGRGRRPAINVSWNDAQEYAAWLSSKTGKIYRLLTEAEWEYAARAGSATSFAFGDTITKSQAQFSEGAYASAGRSVEVGAFKPNKFGLHDMHGNVWEWCGDNWHRNYLGAPQDGSLWRGGDGSRRVLRGGSWVSSHQVFLRSANRVGEWTGVRTDEHGFRVARTLLDEASAARPAKVAPPPVLPPKKAPNQARPDALRYSSKIWTRGEIRRGQTVSSDTPYGKLTCTNLGPTDRRCSWQ